MMGSFDDCEELNANKAVGGTVLAVHAGIDREADGSRYPVVVNHVFS